MTADRNRALADKKNRPQVTDDDYCDALIREWNEKSVYANSNMVHNCLQYTIGRING